MIRPVGIARVHCHAVGISNRGGVLDLNHRCKLGIQASVVPGLVLWIVASGWANHERYNCQRDRHSDDENEEHHPVDNEMTGMV